MGNEKRASFLSGSTGTLMRTVSAHRLLHDGASATPGVHSDSATRKPQTRLARIGKLGAIWGTATIVSLFVIATFYALFFGRFKRTTNEIIYEGHYKVGQAGSMELYTNEGNGITTYGENGLVANKELQPDAVKVLFFGDSFVIARQVSDHQKFTELVEQKWNSAHPELRIQTLNLGLPGRDMSDYLHFGRKMDQSYQPDVVFMFASQYDFIPQARLEKNTRHLAQPAPQSPVSRIVDVLTNTWYHAFVRRLMQQTYAFADSIQDEEAVEGKTNFSTQTDTETISIELQGLKDIWGDRLVIIYHTYIRDMGRDVSNICEDNVLAEIERHSIPTVLLCQPLVQAYQAHRPPTGFHNSILGLGHLNAYGHQLVADEIVKFLETSNDLF